MTGTAGSVRQRPGAHRPPAAPIAPAPAGRVSPTIGPLARRLGAAYVVIATLSGFAVMAEIARPKIRLALLVLPIGMMILSPRGALARVRVVLPVVWLVTWTVASLAWTTSRYATVEELRTTTTLIVAMVLVASLLPVKELLAWQTRAFQVSLVLTMVLLVLVPASGISALIDGTPVRAWRGGFVHKNSLGTFLALAMPCVLAFEARRFWKRSTVVVIGILAVGTNSITALAGLLLGAALWLWLGMMQRRSPRARANILVVALPIALFCILAALSSLTIVAGFFGKDLTLTGRTAIWAPAFDVAKRRPLTGYGPGGLYSWPWSEQTQYILNRAGFWHNHVHNGLLEVQLALGLVGVGLILTLVALCVSDGVRLWRHDPIVSRWLITSVLVILVMSLSERTFTGPGWLSMLVLMRIVGLRVRDEVPDRLSGAAAAPM